jgi:hypothetical protein
MIIRELKPRSSGWMAGSSGPLQARSMMVVSRRGSTRVIIAQSTSFMS